MEEKKITIEELDKMKNIDIHSLDRNSLVDINDIKIKECLSQEERVIDLIKQIGNPYCFKVGKMTVKISFSDTRVTIEERIKDYFLSL